MVQDMRKEEGDLCEKDGKGENYKGRRLRKKSKDDSNHETQWRWGGGRRCVRSQGGKGSKSQNGAA